MPQFLTEKERELLRIALGAKQGSLDLADSIADKIDSGQTGGGLALDGTNSPEADIDWGGNKITNLADPTSAQDAATKAYVDAASPNSLHLDGSNSPTANIDWDGYDLTNVGDLTAEVVTAVGQVHVGTQLMFDNDGQYDLGYDGNSYQRPRDIIAYRAIFAEGSMGLGDPGGWSGPDNLSDPLGDPRIAVNGRIELETHITWHTDGGGDIGSLDGGSTFFRPNNVWIAGNLEVAGTINGGGGGSGDLIFTPDNTHDIGTDDDSATFNRPRHIFSGSAILAGTHVHVGYQPGGGGVGSLLFEGTGHVGTDGANFVNFRPIDYYGSGDIHVDGEFFGDGLNIVDGANATMGRATLVGGTVVVSTNRVTASSNIFLTSQVDGGTLGFLRVSARSAGVSFTITSDNILDTSEVAWLIVEPI